MAGSFSVGRMYCASCCCRELLEEGEVLIVDPWVVIDNDRGLIVLDGVTRATKYSYIIQKAW